MESTLMSIVIGRGYGGLHLWGHGTLWGAPRWPWWWDTKGLHMHRIPSVYGHIPLGIWSYTPRYAAHIAQEYLDLWYVSVWFLGLWCVGV